MLSRHHKHSKDKKDDGLDLSPLTETYGLSIEYLKRLASDTHKGLTQHFFIGRKNKKYPEQQFASVLRESSDKSGGHKMLFNRVIREVSDSFTILSSYHKDLEGTLDSQVAEPLIKLSDETCSNLSKQRRNLNKSLVDVRGTRDQLIKAAAATGSDASLADFDASWNNTNTIATSNGSTFKSTNDVVNRLHVAFQEKATEFSSSKELFLRNLYALIADEENHCNLLLDMFKVYKQYLTDSLEHVEKTIVNLEDTIQDGKRLTVFGRHLDEHLTETNRKISYTLEVCIRYLDDIDNIQVEGIFRKSASQRKTEFIARAINIMIPEDEYRPCLDVISVAAVLKHYLNSLPEPLITFKFAEKWTTSWKIDEATNVDFVASCLQEMPESFRLNLAYLILFCTKVVENQLYNKMRLESLSLVIAPNIYRLPSSSSNQYQYQSMEMLSDKLELLETHTSSVALTHLLIKNAHTLFADEKVLLSEFGFWSCSSQPTNVLPPAPSRQPTQEPIATLNTGVGNPFDVNEDDFLAAKQQMTKSNNGSNDERTAVSPSNRNGKANVLRKKGAAPKPPPPLPPPPSVPISDPITFTVDEQPNNVAMKDTDDFASFHSNLFEDKPEFNFAIPFQIRSDSPKQNSIFPTIPPPPRRLAIGLVRQPSKEAPKRPPFPDLPFPDSSSNF